MYWALILVVLSNFSNGVSGTVIKSNANFIDDILRFCESNGKKYSSVTSFTHNLDRKTIRQRELLFSLAQRRKMYTRFLSSFSNAKDLIARDFARRRSVDRIDSTIIFTSNEEIVDKKIAEEYLKLISQTKIRSSILVIGGDVSNPKPFNIDILTSILTQLQENIFFYVVYANKMKNGTIGMIWNQVIMLQNNPKVIVNKLAFDESYRIVER